MAVHNQCYVLLLQISGSGSLAKPWQSFWPDPRSVNQAYILWYVCTYMVDLQTCRVCLSMCWSRKITANVHKQRESKHPNLSSSRVTVLSQWWGRQCSLHTHSAQCHVHHPWFATQQSPMQDLHTTLMLWVTVKAGTAVVARQKRTAWLPGLTK